jgi:hypothetical protein
MCSRSIGLSGLSLSVGGKAVGLATVPALQTCLLSGSGRAIAGSGTAASRRPTVSRPRRTAAAEL